MEDTTSAPQAAPVAAASEEQRPEPRGGWVDEEREAAGPTQQNEGSWRLIPINGLPPAPRSGHTAVAHAGVVFCFGGYNGTSHFASVDMLTLGNAGAIWSPVPCANTTVARTLHTCVVDGNAMYVFGGVGTVETRRSLLWGTSQTQQVVFNSVSKFDFNNRAWEELTVTGIVPTARDGHTAVSWNGAMTVFGGSDDTRLFNDTGRFVFSRNSWVPCATSGTTPAPRRMHSAVVLDTPTPTMFVFGGYDGRTAFNDSYALDMRTLVWSPIVVRGTVSPSPRYGHSAVCGRDNKVYVFGGYGSGLGYRADLHRFDLATSTWSVVDLAPSPEVGPTPRRRHAAVMLGDTMVIVGGACAPGAGAGGYLNDTWEFSSASAEVCGAVAGGNDVDGALQLAEDMARMLESAELSDVCFAFSEPEKRVIRAHRAVLSARCEVLARLLSSPMREGASQTVSIEDCSYEAFAALLRFLYTGSIPPCSTAQTFAEMLELSDRYLLPRLKRRCESALASSVDEENVAALIIMADTHRCTKLRSEAIAFAAKHHAAMLKTPAFRELPQAILLEIMTELSKISS